MKRKKRTYSGTLNSEISERELRNQRIARKVAAEGMVLLKNKGQFLPLEKGKRIALFGGGACHTIKGGTGSGDVNERKSVSILQGLECAGFEITSKKWLDDYKERFAEARMNWKALLMKKASEASPTDFFRIYSSQPFRMPSGRKICNSDYTQDTDTAIFVVSRIAGEGGDRSAAAGDYYFSDDEKENLNFLCSHFEHVVLVLNIGSQMDLSCLKQWNHIDSILYMGQAGMEGGNALADIMSGKVTPSGKLTDTWAELYEDYPASDKFSHNDGDTENEYYEEGIYVGYRYFDSFGIRPLYCFGFGLSYTEFQILFQENPIAADEEKQKITVKLEVQNIGKEYAGKEAIQVYVSCPQTGLDKERKRLCGFTKTKLLRPGERECVEIAFPAKALASFDEKAHSWIIEGGLYGVWVGNSLDQIQLCGAIKIDETTEIEKVNRICPVTEKLCEKRITRKDAVDFEKSWHQMREERKLPEVLFRPEKREHPDKKELEAEKRADALTEGLSKELLIYMVIGEIGKGHNQAANNMLGCAGIMIPGAAGETSSSLEEEYGIPGIVMADGPAGIRLAQSYQVSDETGRIHPKGLFDALEGGFFAEPVVHKNASTYYQYCTAFPVGTLLAQSWNIELLEETGRAIGEEMQEFGITLWLAPGMNIHRDPLCGRNFEYYSEDPFLSGTMAAAITNGVQSGKGIGTTIKHFACNNQEENRKGTNSILSERALREIYLRGFEIAVKTAQPMAVMTSYNLVNGIHCANSYDLCTEVLRKEWGFKGIVMTDWTTTNPDGGSIPWKCIFAGNDLIMPGSIQDVENIREALEQGELSKAELRMCAKRLVSVIYQSNCYEDAVSYGKQFKEINKDEK